MLAPVVSGPAPRPAARYQALADRFGYTVDAADLATVRDGDEFLDLMAGAIARRMR